MERLLTAAEVAGVLNCHLQTVYRNRGLPCINIPGVGKRFKESDLNKYLEQKSTFLLKNTSSNLPFTPAVPVLYIGGDKGEMPKGKTKTRINFGFGAIYQRKTKGGKIRWYLDYRDGGGNRIQKVVPQATSKEEAVVALRDEISRAFSREHGVKFQKEKIKFKEFAEIYLNNYSIVKKKSWERTDKVYLNANLVPYFGDCALREITTYHAEKFIAKRLKDGVKKSTINRDLACLRKMFNKAIDWDYTGSNPISKVKLFSEKEYKRDRILSVEEEKRLYREAAPHLKPILTCALMTAMRISEILSLKWDHVDLERRKIVIQAGTNKSGRKRIIPINDTLLEELSSLNNASGDFVFLYRDPKTGKHRPVESIKKAFKMACKRANIENLKFHDLRHSAASRLISRGVDPVAVQYVLGHSNLKTTEIYLHSNFRQMQEAVKKLDTKSYEKRKKPGNLLHSCDMEYVTEKHRSLISSFSVN